MPGHGLCCHRRHALGGTDQAQAQRGQAPLFERHRDQAPVVQLLGESQAGVEGDAETAQQEAFQHRQGVGDRHRLVRALEGIHLVAEEGLHRGRVILVHQRVGAALVQGDGRARRELVIQRHDGAHRTRHVFQHRDPAAPGRGEGQSQIRVLMAARDGDLHGSVKRKGGFSLDSSGSRNWTRSMVLIRQIERGVRGVSGQTVRRAAHLPAAPSLGEPG